ncbi:MAG: zinc-dependent peptidase [Lewinellaceae bacterium]|nr:zinc-dependent peptidase [Lewinellaceae bacterium]
MDSQIIMSLLVLAAVLLPAWFYLRKNRKVDEQVARAFPKAWKKILLERVWFYKELDTDDRGVFEKRIQLFLATKHIQGVDTTVDDTVLLLVACSAIIPTFAFPEYNYPKVSAILIYPGSFDEEFQTRRYEGHKAFIIGMVGVPHQQGTVILSKPDLLKGFDGIPHPENVGIHEFVHLLDKADGAVDGVPEMLLNHQYVGPWLQEIKDEIKRIVAGNSDINPYSLTNNAEFLAVVSEYFFNHPEKFEKRHPELYALLARAFKTEEEDTEAEQNPAANS